MKWMKTPEQIAKIKYLSRYKWIEKDIDRKTEELEAWKSRLFKVTSTLSDMPKSFSRSDRIADGIVSISEIEDKLQCDIKDLVISRIQIEDIINGVSNDLYKEILKCKYIDGQNWEEIAFTNSYTWRHVHRLHEAALEAIII